MPKAKNATCKVCNKKCRTKNELDEHCNTGKKHKGIGPCKECGEMFTRFRILKRHENKCDGKRKNIKRSLRKEATCAVCNAPFSSQNKLHKHADENRHKAFLCPKKCGRGFFRAHHIKDHLGSCQGEGAKINIPAQKSICAEEGCDVECPSKRELNKHGVAEGHKPFKCDGCGTPYQYFNSLNNHLQKGGGNCPNPDGSSSTNSRPPRKKGRHDIPADDRSYQAYLSAVINYRDGVKERLSLLFEEDGKGGTDVNNTIILSNVLFILDSLNYFGLAEDFDDDGIKKMRWKTFNDYQQFINQELVALKKPNTLQKALTRSVAELPGIRQITGRFKLSPINDNSHNCFLRCLFNDPNSWEDSPRVAEARGLITRYLNIPVGDFIGLFDEGVIELLRKHYSDVLGTLHVHILTYEGVHIELNPIWIGQGENRHFLHTINHFTLLIPEEDAKQEVQRGSASSSSSSRKRRGSRSPTPVRGSDSDKKMRDDEEKSPDAEKVPPRKRRKDNRGEVGPSGEYPDDHGENVDDRFSYDSDDGTAGTDFYVSDNSISDTEDISNIDDTNIGDIEFD